MVRKKKDLDHVRPVKNKTLGSVRSDKTVPTDPVRTDVIESVDHYPGTNKWKLHVGNSYYWTVLLWGDSLTLVLCTENASMIPRYHDVNNVVRGVEPNSLDLISINGNLRWKNVPEDLINSFMGFFRKNTKDVSTIKEEVEDVPEVEKVDLELVAIFTSIIEAKSIKEARNIARKALIDL